MIVTEPRRYRRTSRIACAFSSRLHRRVFDRQSDTLRHDSDTEQFRTDSRFSLCTNGSFCRTRIGIPGLGTLML